MKKTPKSLRIWFLAHFLVDMFFAIPLMIAPNSVMKMLGLPAGNSVTARLVAAALIGIGLTSLLENKKDIESYDSLLTLKIVWAAAAILAIAVSSAECWSNAAWIILGIFAVFLAVWLFYKIKIAKNKD